MTFIRCYSTFIDGDLSLRDVIILVIHTHYFCDFTDLARVADSIHDLQQSRIFKSGGARSRNQTLPLL